MAVNTEIILTTRITKEQTIPLERSIAREKIKLDKQFIQTTVDEINEVSTTGLDLEIEYATQTDGQNLIFKGAEARLSGSSYYPSGTPAGFIKACDELLSGENNIDALREEIERYNQKSIIDENNVESAFEDMKEEEVNNLDSIKIGDGLVFGEAMGKNGMPRPMLDIQMQLSHASHKLTVDRSLSKELLGVAQEVGLQTTGIEDDYQANGYAIGLKNPEIDAVRFFNYFQQIAEEYEVSAIIGTKTRRKIQNKVSDMMG